MLTLTSAPFQTLRNYRGYRGALILALGVALAVGTGVPTPVKAYASTPEAHAALHSVIDYWSRLAVFGTDVAFGSERSTDSGATWVPGPSPYVTWQMAVNGTLVGYESAGDKYTAVVYTVATGAQSSYPLPGNSWPASMNASWMLSGVGGYSAYNFLNGGTSIPLAVPTGATVTAPSAQLTQSGGILWSGTTTEGHSVYAVAASPSAPAPTWISVGDWARGAIATPTQLVYVLAVGSTLQICSRPLSSLTGAPTCSAVMTGVTDTVYAYLSNFGSSTVVGLEPLVGVTHGKRLAFLWDGAAAVTVQVPSGSTVEAPPAFGSDVYGASAAYVIVRDSNTVPSLKKVNADGTLSQGFTYPPHAATGLPYLAIANDRVVGADSRDGASELPVWTRPISSGVGAETLLPSRTTRGVAASAARTVVATSSGFAVYDRGALRNTIPGDELRQLSGPYVTRPVHNSTANRLDIEADDVNGVPRGTFAGTTGSLFGSEYVTWGNGPYWDVSSPLHVVVNDLTGRSAPRLLDLPAGTSYCKGGSVWGDSLLMACPGKYSVFNLSTGAEVASLPATNTTDSSMTLGDGYATGLFNGLSSLWDFATDSVDLLLDCTGNLVTDGTGHVACTGKGDLTLITPSALATGAPRLLGAMANPTADFSDASNTWKIDVDTTKALKAGIVAISRADGTVVRKLATDASPDGSIRGAWNGLDDSTKPVPPGVYTYKLLVDGADGSGTVTTLDGTGQVTGQVVVTSANPAGMSAGAQMSVSPSRILDTRITGPKLSGNTTRTLKVTGVGGVPSTNVSAVVLNVTVTETTNNGYLTVSPTGTTRPVVSNLNWTTGTTIPNAVTVKVGTGGSIDLYQSGPGTAQVIVDVAGYYVNGALAEPGAFSPITPARILDSRTTGGRFASNETRDLQILGQGGVPADTVSAVVLNVTVTETTAGGYLTVFPSGQPKPLASNLNWSPGLTIPNLVTVQVGTNGKVSIYQSGTGTSQVVVDVAGYYLGGSPTKPGMFVALSPARALDTRATGAVPAGGNQALAILGKGGIPSAHVSSVVINTTVTETRAPGYVTVFPGTGTLPAASNLNWSAAGSTIANLVTTQIFADGTIAFHNGSGGTTQVVADTAGYFIGA